MDRLKLRSGFTLGWILLLMLILQGGVLYGQDVTISQLTGGVAASPLVAGSTNQAILGIEFSKAAGGTNDLQSIVIALTEDPAGRFTNVRLCRSDNNNSFDGADLANPVGTVAVGSSPDEITVSGSITTFGGNASAQVRRYFLVVDINPAVTGATANIQPSLDPTDVTLANNTVLGTTVTGTDYAFTGATVTITQLTGGIAPDPLGSATTNQAVLGFSLTSNSNLDFTAITIHTTSDAGGKLTNIRLFSSADNSFGGDASIATASSVTASTIVFTGLSEGLSGSASYFFVVANVEPTVNASTPQIELSFDEGDVVAAPATVQPATITGTDYSFADVAPPSITARTPADNATGIAISLNTLQITFDENVVYVGDNSDADNMIRIRDLDASAFIDTIAVSNVSVVGNVVTLTFSTPLTSNTHYAIRIGNSVFEDAEGNAYAGITNDTSWNFETESGPDITSYSADPTCVGETITINGTGFGIATPNVTVNGVTAVVNSHTTTTISIVVPNTTSGPVVVTNNFNGLSGNDNTLTLKPAIAASLTLAPNPPAPAVNQNYDIDVAGTQNGVNYAIRELPGGFGGTTAGTGGSISFGPYNKSSDGTFQYEVRATSAGCTQQVYGPLSVVIAALSVNAGVNTTICTGDSVVLGGSPTAAGGTGFYSIKWYKLPSGTVISTATNPQVKPTSNSIYRVVINDTPSNFRTDSITVTVNPKLSADSLSILLNPAKPNNTYSSVDAPVVLTFTRNGNPGVFGGNTRFDGTGVNSDGPTKYFYPDAANLGPNNITLFYENEYSCVTNKSILVEVRDNNDFVNGLLDNYCEQNLNITNLSMNQTVYYPPYFYFRFTGFLGIEIVFVDGFRYTYRGDTDLNDLATNVPIVAPGFTVSGTGSRNLTINTAYTGVNYKIILGKYYREQLQYNLSDPANPIFVDSVTNYFNVARFYVIKKPDLSISLPLEVCESEEQIALNGTAVPAGGTFEINGTGGAFFDPGAPGLPNSTVITYIYTDPSNTCPNSIDHTVTINRIPTITDITFSNGCVGDTINIAPVFSNPTNINFAYAWDADGADGYETKVPSNIASPIKRTYSVASIYPILLQLITDKGCIAEESAFLTIGQVPDLAMTWQNVCDGDQTRFAFKSNYFKNNIGLMDSVIWNFGDGTPVTKIKSPGLADSVASRLYTTTDYFTASVKVRTDLNCANSDTVFIYKVPKTGPVGVTRYLEDFNDAAFEDQGWKTGGTNSSWQWGTPAATLITSDNPGGGNAWVTNLAGTYNASEDSWVHSPCFDLSQIERPILSFDFRSLMREGVDGVVLQYNTKNTTNREADWKTVGSVNTGKNWYNRIAIGANPGNQALLQTGWTGNIDSAAWRSGTIPLDDLLSTIPLIERNKIRFRFAFASSNFIPDAEGFALDNFKIAQRDRLVLLEHFTNNGGVNTAGEPNKVSNQTINTFMNNSSGEVTKLEYHVGISGPNEDPLYEDNRIDANARAAFYGVTSTPMIFIDSRSGNFAATFSEQKLQPAGVSIDTIFTPASPSDKLNIQVQFTARQFLPPNTVLHIAVVEKEIVDAEARGTNGETSFKYVVKKMLPDAVGTRFNTALLDGQSRTVNVSWSPKAYRLDSLAIIAFIQNQDTREIYQARFLKDPTNIPSGVVTGMEPSFAEQIIIFPNPAQGELNIQLPRKYNQQVPVSLIDGFGREVHNSAFKPGELQKTIGTSGYAAGIYILQIKSDKGEVARKKIIVVN